MESGVQFLVGLAIYAAIYVLALLVHEFGHLVVARRMGVAVEEVAIGLKPWLVCRTVAGTVWRFGALPVVGWVRMERASYQALGPGPRMAIKAAGPAANIAFGGAVLLLHSVLASEWQTPAAAAHALHQGMVAFGAVAGGLAGNMLDRAVSVWTRVPPEQMALIQTSIGDTVALRALFWAGVVSVGMGLVNSLPVPPLDGFHVTSHAVEWACGQGAARNVEGVLLVVGSAALLAIVVFAP